MEAKMIPTEQRVFGIFPDEGGARRAIEELVRIGVPQDKISILAPSGPRDQEPTDARRTFLGAGIGGGAGVLAGLATLAIPGIGQVAGAGWLMIALGAALTGGLAGGTVGAFVSAGVTEEEAHASVEALRGGQHVVIARVNEDQADPVAKAFLRLGALDSEAQRAVYRTEGHEFE